MRSRYNHSRQRKLPVKPIKPYKKYEGGKSVNRKIKNSNGYTLGGRSIVNKGIVAMVIALLAVIGLTATALIWA